jgi:hypothetical protein
LPDPPGSFRKNTAPSPWAITLNTTMIAIP